MSRFVGLSLMCLMFMSAQAHDNDQYWGSSYFFQSHQDGDGEGEFQSESKTFDGTGLIKHDRIKGNLEDGVWKITSRENLKDAEMPKNPSPYKVGENSKWIYPIVEFQKSANKTEANLMDRSRIPFGNFFKSRKPKHEAEHGFKKSWKMRSPFSFFPKTERKPHVKSHPAHKIDHRFNNHPNKEVMNMFRDMQRQMDEMRKQNQIMMKRIQNFEKYFFGDFSED